MKKLGLILAIIALLLSLVTGYKLFFPKLNLGSYTTDPTVLTDLHISNDLVVDGATTHTGATTQTGALTTVADTRLATRLDIGTIAAKTASTTATTAATNVFTAANICDAPLITTSNGATGTITWTLPPTSTLWADCLTTNGDSRTFNFYNADTVTSSIIAAGTGGTLLYSSSATVAASKGARITIIRDATGTYKAFLVNLPN